MTRTLLAATVAALALTGPALAGGTGPAAQPPVIIPVAPTPDWGGFYGGVMLEWGQGTVSNSGAPGRGPTSVDIDGINYGIFAGYRVDYGSTVFGVELDLVSSDMSVSGGVGEVDSLIRGTLEYGVDTGNAFLYGTAGVFGATISPSGPFDDYDWGFVGGFGVDYRLSASTFLAAEVLYHRIDDFSGSGADIDATTIGLGIGFEF
ncbi:outer membrane protein [Roseicyclus persicicus]|uniref:Porin family protein n=1 Tax=Roseicyclus persicicus TaxID=2650661 RepID=A0A7X6JY16_9RHOB|nr:outer membrane beta-barrel protein [Roseibacterium persicicum]NKX46167.1 porin family protein [Roseibacterium persicicum]